MFLVNRAPVPVRVTANPSHVPDNHPQVPADPADEDRFHGFHTNAGDSGDEDEGNASDHGNRKIRATRNSKSHGDAKPSQLGYYSGPWVTVLTNARNSYRKHIHTSDPFPERNLENLNDARNILLEAIGEYKDNGFDLDEG